MFKLVRYALAAPLAILWYAFMLLAAGLCALGLLVTPRAWFDA